MAWTAQIIEIFLSSPSDVSRERVLVRKIIDEWNQRRGKSEGCIFTILGWETVTAEIEGYAQGSINDQLGDEYDVMLGLMWARYGTPTGKEDSGTFEEFKRALDRKRAGSAVRISFYFKQAPLDIDQIDPEQISRVKRFKQFIRDEGGLTGDFTDEDSLRISIDNLLERIAKDKSKYTAKDSSNDFNIDNNLGSDAAQDTLAEEIVIAQGDIGLLDIFESFDGLVEKLASEMDDWSANISHLGESAERATADLQDLAQFGTPPAKEVRAVIDRVTEEFNENAQFVEERSPVLIALMANFSGLLDAQAELLPDFEFPVEEGKQRISELIELSASMTLAHKNARALLDSVAALPRMAMAFNLARRRLIQSYDPFLRELERSTRAVSRTIGAMRKALPAEEASEIAPPRHQHVPKRPVPPPSRKRTRRKKTRRKN